MSVRYNVNTISQAMDSNSGWDIMVKEFVMMCIFKRRLIQKCSNHCGNSRKFCNTHLCIYGEVSHGVMYKKLMSNESTMNVILVCWLGKLALGYYYGCWVINQSWRFGHLLNTTLSAKYYVGLWMYVTPCVKCYTCCECHVMSSESVISCVGWRMLDRLCCGVWCWLWVLSCNSVSCLSAGYTPIRGTKPSGFRQPSQAHKEHWGTRQLTWRVLPSDPRNGEAGLGLGRSGKLCHSEAGLGSAYREARCSVESLVLELCFTDVGMRFGRLRCYILRDRDIVWHMHLHWSKQGEEESKLATKFYLVIRGRGWAGWDVAFSEMRQEWR